MFEVKVDFSDAAAIIQKKGLGAGGATQTFFTSEVMRLSDSYTPMRSAVLKNTAIMTPQKDGIIYTAPYSRYQWYGKLMVDPKTGKGAFYNPITGRFWSRPRTKKVLTDKDLKYNGAPIRGARWVERCWIDNKDDILQSTERYVNGK